jgi:hypothetical protein
VEEDVHAGAVGNHVEATLDGLRIVKGRDPTETQLFHDTSDARSSADSCSATPNTTCRECSASVDRPQ